jgi:hypothetical protein
MMGVYYCHSEIGSYHPNEPLEWVFKGGFFWVYSETDAAFDTEDHRPLLRGRFL